MRTLVKGDPLFVWITRVFAFFPVLIALLIGVLLFVGAWPAFKTFHLAFLFNTVWDPVAQQFGALPFLYGTVVSSMLALVLAVPLSLGIAIFLAEFAPRVLRTPLSFSIELLAAIPSVIYGLWGIFFLVPWLRETVEPFLIEWVGFLPLFEGPPYGLGMFAAGVVLAIMIVPIIASISRDVLLAVPNAQREAALALGATRWEAIWLAVLKYGRSGIVGAVFLGWGRAIGETMAVTMVIGNRPEIALSLFAPGHTMASVIANEFAEASGELYLSALVAIGFVLFAVTLLFNALARWLIWKTAHAEVRE